MLKSKTLTLSSILSTYKLPIALTWLLVLIENSLTACIALFVGYSLDGLLKGDTHDFYVLAGILVSITFIAVARRFYDTRVYGSIRVALSQEVVQRLQDQPLTVRNARLDMSRELVDFLENNLPTFITAVVQVIASVVILASFHYWLGLSAVIAGVVILTIYAMFHQQFLQLNKALNNQMERQVAALSLRPGAAIANYLEKLRAREVRLSDTEAVVYGMVFLALFGFVLFNLWLTAETITHSAGNMFSIVSYSLEFLQAAVMLPVTLQTLSRLSEIKQRINIKPRPEINAVPELV